MTNFMTKSALNRNLVVTNGELENVSAKVQTITRFALKKYGKIVVLSMGMNLSDSVTAGELLFNLPSGFIPCYEMNVPMVDVNNYSGNLFLSFNIDGSCNLGGQSITGTSKTWIYVNACYIIE